MRNAETSAKSFAGHKHAPFLLEAMLLPVFVDFGVFELFMRACACLARLFMTSGMKCSKAFFFCRGIAPQNGREITRNEREKVRKGAK